MQHRRRVREVHRRVELDQIAQPIEQCVRQLDSNLDALILTHVEQRQLDLATDVPRNPVGRIGGIQTADIDR